MRKANRNVQNSKGQKMCYLHLVKLQNIKQILIKTVNERTKQRTIHYIKNI